MKVQTCSDEIRKDTVVRTIRNIETIVVKLHSEYVGQRLVKATSNNSSHSSERGEPNFALIHNLKLLILKSIAT